VLDTIHRIETPEGVDLDLRTAGPAPRLLAWIIDLCLRGVITIGVSIPLSALGKLGGGVFLIVLFALEWLYPVIFEVLADGSTPGKRAVGLRVIRLDGTPVDWGASTLRNLLRTADFLPALFGFGLISMLYTRRFQRLGDLAAGTVVVYRRRGAARAAALPETAPRPPPLPLELDEQRAIIRFAQGAQGWSATRARELSEVAARPLQAVRDEATAATARDPVAYLLSVAAWLAGKRGDEASR